MGRRQRSGRRRRIRQRHGSPAACSGPPEAGVARKEDGGWWRRTEEGCRRTKEDGAQGRLEGTKRSETVVTLERKAIGHETIVGETIGREAHRGTQGRARGEEEERTAPLTASVSQHQALGRGPADPGRSSRRPARSRRRVAMAVEERDRRSRRFVNLFQIGQPRIVGRHVLEDEIGVPQNDRDVVLQGVLKLVFVSHGRHQRNCGALSPASRLLPPAP